MDPHARRTFLKEMTALAALGVPGIAAAKANSYDPAARYDLKVTEVPFRKNAQGRELMARIYAPQANGTNAGPFPVVLDLHGGAWQRKDRRAEEPMDRASASSGVLVVAVDLSISGEAPYPAAVQDASYGGRWLKARAAEWNGDSSTLGLYGSSSGGHVAELIAMRPNDKRYNAIPLANGQDSHPASPYAPPPPPKRDPSARWKRPERKPNQNLIKASKTFFQPWE